MTIKIFTTGGTIDKIYFDANSEFQIGDPQIAEVLKEANVACEYSIESVLRKDSLEISPADRAILKQRIQTDSSGRILVTHGTDTMVETALEMLDIKNKTIVFTGAMQPAKLRISDAIFNIGYALAATQLLSAGVYLAINGEIFDPSTTKKNRDKHQFVKMT